MEEENVNRLDNDSESETTPHDTEERKTDEIADETNGLVTEYTSNTTSSITNECTDQNEKTQICPEAGNDNGILNEKTDDQGNLLNNIVTMHNVTNCDDDYSYSPSLAICDIFSKTESSRENETPTLLTKDDECKDEFLIIDLDTCKMERASKKHKTDHAMSGDDKNISQNKCSPKGLIMVNLSSEEIQSDFLNKRVDRNRDNQCENNFLNVTKDCDISYDQKDQTRMENVNRQCAVVEKHKITHLNDDEDLHQIELHLPLKSVEMKNDDFRSKGILFHDMATPHDSNMSNEIFPTDITFNSSDINNVSLHSNENQEYEPVFYMPELCTKIYEDKINDYSPSAFTKMSTINSGHAASSGNQYYEYAINDNMTFENSLSTNQHNNSTTFDFYEHQTQIVPNYSFDDKNMTKMVATDTKRVTTPTYGMSCLQLEQESSHYKKISANGSHKLSSCFSSSGEHKSSSPFCQSSMQSYHSNYPYHNFQQASEANSQFSSSAVSNYSDWNSWSNPTFYEVNLNTFAPVPNMDSHHQQGKMEWPNDTSLPDLYYDHQIGIKSNPVDNDSEATEDADETDDVPTFLENSSDFSACDNISTMSVMSGSCYSDGSSVMTPFSPSDFTPPPSVSNTPISSGGNLEMNAFEDRFSTPFMNESSRSEPIHLYSPTMLSVTPYKLTNEKIDQNFMNYDRNQGSKRFYPSMADIHNSRSGLSISSSSTKFESDEIADFTEYPKSHKSQIQSDKISTSTSRSVYNKRKWNPNTGTDSTESLESFTDFMKQDDGEFRDEMRRCRHNEPLRQTAIRIMSQWYEQHLDNPYPTKEDKTRMARDGGITVTQVKSWFANKRNRTNNTKPKVQKRAMKEKLKKLFQDLKHSRSDSLDNSHIIQQLSGIIQN